MRPKPMVEIGGKPILWHIMKIYSAHGINDFVDLPRLQGLRDQGVLRQLLPAHVRRDVRPARATRMEVHQQHGRAVAGDARRHRRRHDDRRPAAARRSTTSATRTFCFTYGDGVADVDIADARSSSTASRARSRRSPRSSRPGRFGALEIDGDRVTRLPREAARRRRLDQRRLLRAVARACVDYLDGDDTVWEREPLERLARDGQLAAYRARRLLAADGHAARQAPARGAVGLGRRAVEGVGVDAGVLARPARPRHRPHRLQGQLARALAAAPRRRGHRAVAPASPTEPVAVRARRASATASHDVDGDVRDADAVRDARRRARARRSSSTWPPSRSCGARSRAASRPTRPT